MMMKPNDAFNPDNCCLALHLCALALEKQNDIASEIEFLNRTFNCKTLDDTLVVATKLLSCEGIRQAKEKYGQLEHDFKIIKDYSSKEHYLKSLGDNSFIQAVFTSTQEYFSTAIQLLTSQRFQNKAEIQSLTQQVEPPPGAVDFMISCQEAIEFLYDFAPIAAHQFQLTYITLETSANAEQRLEKFQKFHEEVFYEIGVHLTEILEALKLRCKNKGRYVQTGCYNKLMQFVREINFLIIFLLNDKSLKSSMVIEAFEPGGSKGLDVCASRAKAIKLLSVEEENIANAREKYRMDNLKAQWKKLADFLRAADPTQAGSFNADFEKPNSPSSAGKCFVNLQSFCTDLLLEKIKMQLDFINDGENHPIQLGESWMPVLLKDAGAYLDAMEFSAKFCREPLHPNKMRIFHLYLTKWLETYPPNPKVDADTLILFIKSMLLLTKNPEVLLEVILLEDATISFKPANTNCAFDYAPGETADGSGIFCYHYLNLTNAFMDICRNQPRIEDEVKILHKRGNFLVKIFCGMGLSDKMPNWINQDGFDEIAKNRSINLDEKKERLLVFYEKIKQKVEQGFLIRLLEYRSKIVEDPPNSMLVELQAFLIENEGFKAEAGNWAAEFIKEKNAILKMNKHGVRVNAIKEAYFPKNLEFTTENMKAFLLALIIAGEEPGLITEMLFLDGKSLEWRLAIEPGRTRKHDYAVMKSLVGHLIGIPDF